MIIMLNSGRRKRKKNQIELVIIFSFYSYLLEWLRRENERLAAENIQLERDVNDLHQSSTLEENQFVEQVQQLQQEKQELERIYEEREGKRMELEQSASIMNDLEKRASEGEMVRRRLHNTLQELRGNLRVIARVRPLLPSDRSISMEPAVWCGEQQDVFVNYKNRIQHFFEYRLNLLFFLYIFVQ